MAMLTEEALILGAVFVGLALLALGIWREVSPAPGRSPERRPDDERARVKR